MRKFWIILLFLLFVVTSAQAQPTWEVVLYVETSAYPDFAAELIFIHSNGTVENVPLPAGLAQGADPNFRRQILL